ncbi:Helix-turn-helix domain protein [compost metagenome]
MFTQLFSVPAFELSNRSQELELVLPEVAAFIRSRFDATMDFSRITDLLDSLFIGYLQEASLSYDNRLYDAIQIILKNYGVVDIKNDLDTGISPRQLHRLFDFYVGTSAKTFSQVVRFQNILKAKPSSQSLRENKLFYDVGYYDQSHFIKDFKNFYGVTPSKAFGR